MTLSASPCAVLSVKRADDPIFECAGDLSCLVAQLPALESGTSFAAKFGTRVTATVGECDWLHADVRAGLSVHIMVEVIGSAAPSRATAMHGDAIAECNVFQGFDFMSLEMTRSQCLGVSLNGAGTGWLLADFTLSNPSALDVPFALLNVSGTEELEFAPLRNSFRSCDEVGCATGVSTNVLGGGESITVRSFAKLPAISEGTTATINSQSITALFLGAHPGLLQRHPDLASGIIGSASLDWSTACAVYEPPYAESPDCRAIIEPPVGAPLGHTMLLYIDCYNIGSQSKFRLDWSDSYAISGEGCDPSWSQYGCNFGTGAGFPVFSLPYPTYKRTAYNIRAITNSARIEVMGSFFDGIQYQDLTAVYGFEGLDIEIDMPSPFLLDFHRPQTASILLTNTRADHLPWDELVVADLPGDEMTDFGVADGARVDGVAVEERSSAMLGIRVQELGFGMTARVELPLYELGSGLLDPAALTAANGNPEPPGGSGASSLRLRLLVDSGQPLPVTIGADVPATETRGVDVQLVAAAADASALEDAWEDATGEALPNSAGARAAAHVLSGSPNVFALVALQSPYPASGPGVDLLFVVIPEAGSFDPKLIVPTNETILGAAGWGSAPLFCSAGMCPIPSDAWTSGRFMVVVAGSRQDVKRPASFGIALQTIAGGTAPTLWDGFSSLHVTVPEPAPVFVRAIDSQLDLASNSVLYRLAVTNAGTVPLSGLLLDSFGAQLGAMDEWYARQGVVPAYAVTFPSESRAVPWFNVGLAGARGRRKSGAPACLAEFLALRVPRALSDGECADSDLCELDEIPAGAESIVSLRLPVPRGSAPSRLEDGDVFLYSRAQLLRGPGELSGGGVQGRGVVPVPAPVGPHVPAAGFVCSGHAVSAPEDAAGLSAFAVTCFGARPGVRLELRGANAGTRVVWSERLGDGDEWGRAHGAQIEFSEDGAALVVAFSLHRSAISLGIFAAAVGPEQGPVAQAILVARDASGAVEESLIDVTVDGSISALGDVGVGQPVLFPGEIDGLVHCSLEAADSALVRGRDEWPANAVRIFCASEILLREFSVLLFSCDGYQILPGPEVDAGAAAGRASRVRVPGGIGRLGAAEVEFAVIPDVEAPDDLELSYAIEAGDYFLMQADGSSNASVLRLPERGAVRRGFVATVSATDLAPVSYFKLATTDAPPHVMPGGIYTATIELRNDHDYLPFGFVDIVPPAPTDYCTITVKTAYSECEPGVWRPAHWGSAARASAMLGCHVTDVPAGELRVITLEIRIAANAASASRIDFRVFAIGASIGNTYVRVVLPVWEAAEVETRLVSAFQDWGASVPGAVKLGVQVRNVDSTSVSIMGFDVAGLAGLAAEVTSFSGTSTIMPGAASLYDVRVACEELPMKLVIAPRFNGVEAQHPDRATVTAAVPGSAALVLNIEEALYVEPSIQGAMFADYFTFAAAAPFTPLFPAGPVTFVAARIRGTVAALADGLGSGAPSLEIDLFHNARFVGVKAKASNASETNAVSCTFKTDFRSDAPRVPDWRTYVCALPPVTSASEKVAFEVSVNVDPFLSDWFAPSARRPVTYVRMRARPSDLAQQMSEETSARPLGTAEMEDFVPSAAAVDTRMLYSWPEFKVGNGGFSAAHALLEVSAEEFSVAGTAPGPGNKHRAARDVLLDVWSSGTLGLDVVDAAGLAALPLDGPGIDGLDALGMAMPTPWRTRYPITLCESADEVFASVTAAVVNRGILGGGPIDVVLRNAARVVAPSANSTALQEALIYGTAARLVLSEFDTVMAPQLRISRIVHLAGVTKVETEDARTIIFHGAGKVVALDDDGNELASATVSDGLIVGESDEVTFAGLVVSGFDSADTYDDFEADERKDEIKSDPEPHPLVRLTIGAADLLVLGAVDTLAIGGGAVPGTLGGYARNGMAAGLVEPAGDFLTPARGEAFLSVGIASRVLVSDLGGALLGGSGATLIRGAADAIIGGFNDSTCVLISRARPSRSAFISGLDSVRLHVDNSCGACVATYVSGADAAGLLRVLEPTEAAHVDGGIELVTPDALLLASTNGARCEVRLGERSIVLRGTDSLILGGSSGNDSACLASAGSLDSVLIGGGDTALRLGSTVAGGACAATDGDHALIVGRASLPVGDSVQGDGGTLSGSDIAASRGRAFVTPVDPAVAECVLERAEAVDVSVVVDSRSPFIIGGDAGSGCVIWLFPNASSVPLDILGTLTAAVSPTGLGDVCSLSVSDHAPAPIEQIVVRAKPGIVCHANLGRFGPILLEGGDAVSVVTNPLGGCAGAGIFKTRVHVAQGESVQVTGLPDGQCSILAFDSAASGAGSWTAGLGCAAVGGARTTQPVTAGPAGSISVTFRAVNGIRIDVGGIAEVLADELVIERVAEIGIGSVSTVFTEFAGARVGASGTPLGGVAVPVLVSRLGVLYPGSGASLESVQAVAISGAKGFSPLWGGRDSSFARGAAFAPSIAVGESIVVHAALNVSGDPATAPIETNWHAFGANQARMPFDRKGVYPGLPAQIVLSPLPSVIELPSAAPDRAPASLLEVVVSNRNSPLPLGPRIVRVSAGGALGPDLVLSGAAIAAASPGVNASIAASGPLSVEFSVLGVPAGGALTLAVNVTASASRARMAAQAILVTAGDICGSLEPRAFVVQTELRGGADIALTDFESRVLPSGDVGVFFFLHNRETTKPASNVVLTAFHGDVTSAHRMVLTNADTGELFCVFEAMEEEPQPCIIGDEIGGTGTFSIPGGVSLPMRLAVDRFRGSQVAVTIRAETAYELELTPSDNGIAGYGVPHEMPLFGEMWPRYQDPFNDVAEVVVEGFNLPLSAVGLCWCLFEGANDAADVPAVVRPRAGSSNLREIACDVRSLSLAAGDYAVSVTFNNKDGFQATGNVLQIVGHWVQTLEFSSPAASDGFSSVTVSPGLLVMFTAGELLAISGESNQAIVLLSVGVGECSLAFDYPLGVLACWGYSDSPFDYADTIAFELAPNASALVWTQRIVVPGLPFDAFSPLPNFRAAALRGRRMALGLSGYVEAGFEVTGVGVIAIFEQAPGGGPTWAEAARVADDSEANRLFGRSVALDSDGATLAVGCGYGGAVSVASVAVELFVAVYLEDGIAWLPGAIYGIGAEWTTAIDEIAAVVALDGALLAAGITFASTSSALEVTRAASEEDVLPSGFGVAARKDDGTWPVAMEQPDFAPGNGADLVTIGGAVAVSRGDVAALFVASDGQARAGAAIFSRRRTGNLYVTEGELYSSAVPAANPGALVSPIGSRGLALGGHGLAIAARSPGGGMTTNMGSRFRGTSDVALSIECLSETVVGTSMVCGGQLHSLGPACAPVVVVSVVLPGDAAVPAPLFVHGAEVIAASGGRYALAVRNVTLSGASFEFGVRFVADSGRGTLALSAVADPQNNDPLLHDNGDSAELLVAAEPIFVSAHPSQWNLGILDRPINVYGRSFPLVADGLALCRFGGNGSTATAAKVLSSQQIKCNAPHPSELPSGGPGLFEVIVSFDRGELWFTTGREVNFVSVWRSSGAPLVHPSSAQEPANFFGSQLAVVGSIAVTGFYNGLRYAVYNRTAGAHGAVGSWTEPLAELSLEGTGLPVLFVSPGSVLRGDTAIGDHTFFVHVRQGEGIFFDALRGMVDPSWMAGFENALVKVDQTIILGAALSSRFAFASVAGVTDGQPTGSVAVVDMDSGSVLPALAPPGDAELFGASVAADGDLLLVGVEEQATDSGPYEFRVHAYAFNGAQFALEQTITWNDGEEYSAGFVFRAHVAVANNVAAVAMAADAESGCPTRLRILCRHSTAPRWRECALFSDGLGVGFSESVSVSDNIVVIAASAHGSAGTLGVADPAVAHVFRRSHDEATSQWFHDLHLKAPGYVPGVRIAVAADGVVAVVGQSCASDPAFAGSVQPFERWEYELSCPRDSFGLVCSGIGECTNDPDWRCLCPKPDQGIACELKADVAILHAATVPALPHVGSVFELIIIASNAGPNEADFVLSYSSDLAAIEFFVASDPAFEEGCTADISEGTFKCIDLGPGESQELRVGARSTPDLFHAHYNELAPPPVPSSLSVEGSLFDTDSSNNAISIATALIFRSGLSVSMSQEFGRPSDAVPGLGVNVTVVNDLNVFARAVELEVDAPAGWAFDTRTQRIDVLGVTAGNWWIAVGERGVAGMPMPPDAAGASAAGSQLPRAHLRLGDMAPGVAATVMLLFDTGRSGANAIFAARAVAFFNGYPQICEGGRRCNDMHLEADDVSPGDNAAELAVVDFAVAPGTCGPVNCWPYGFCSGGAGCLCVKGYGGAHCDRVACPADPAGTGLECSGFACVDGVCACPASRTGVACERAQCAPDPSCSGSGLCIRGACSCNSGWHGDACDLRNCPNDCSNHGDCLNGTCICDDDFHGVGCAEAYTGCPMNCYNQGVCDDNVCRCGAGFAGPACDLRTCPRDSMDVECGAHGICVPKTGKCTCEWERWSGDSCGDAVAPRMHAVYTPRYNAIVVTFDHLMSPLTAAPAAPFDAAFMEKYMISEFWFVGPSKFYAVLPQTAPGVPSQVPLAADFFVSAENGRAVPATNVPIDVAADAPSVALHGPDTAAACAGASTMLRAEVLGGTLGRNVSFIWGCISAACVNASAVVSPILRSTASAIVVPRLSPGEYAFTVAMRNSLGSVSQPARHVLIVPEINGSGIVTVEVPAPLGGEVDRAARLVLSPRTTAWQFRDGACVRYSGPLDAKWTHVSGPTPIVAEGLSEALTRLTLELPPRALKAGNHEFELRASIPEMAVASRGASVSLSVSPGSLSSRIVGGDRGIFVGSHGVVYTEHLTVDAVVTDADAECAAPPCDIETDGAALNVTWSCVYGRVAGASSFFAPGTEAQFTGLPCQYVTGLSFVNDRFAPNDLHQDIGIVSVAPYTEVSVHRAAYDLVFSIEAVASDGRVAAASAVLSPVTLPPAEIVQVTAGAPLAGRRLVLAAAGSCAAPTAVVWTCADLDLDDPSVAPAGSVNERLVVSGAALMPARAYTIYVACPDAAPAQFVFATMALPPEITLGVAVAGGETEPSSGATLCGKTSLALRVDGTEGGNAWYSFWVVRSDGERSPLAPRMQQPTATVRVPCDAGMSYPDDVTMGVTVGTDGGTRDATEQVQVAMSVVAGNDLADAILEVNASAASGDAAGTFGALQRAAALLGVDEAAGGDAGERESAAGLLIDAVEAFAGSSLGNNDEMAASALLGVLAAASDVASGDRVATLGLSLVRGLPRGAVVAGRTGAARVADSLLSRAGGASLWLDDTMDMVAEMAFAVQPDFASPLETPQRVSGALFQATSQPLDASFLAQTGASLLDGAVLLPPLADAQVTNASWILAVSVSEDAAGGGPVIDPNATGPRANASLCGAGSIIRAEFRDAANRPLAAGSGGLGGAEGLSSPIRFTFAAPARYNASEDLAFCAHFASWDALTWSAEGVELSFTADGHGVCSTDHLTYFGVFTVPLPPVLTPTPTPTPTEDDDFPWLVVILVLIAMGAGTAGVVIWAITHKPKRAYIGGMTPRQAAAGIVLQPVMTRVSSTLLSPPRNVGVFQHQVNPASATFYASPG